MKNCLCGIALLVAVAVFACAQEATASVTLAGRAIAIKYSPPASGNRAAASLHTAADLAFQGFNIPKGDYTLYILAQGSQWVLAVNKATGSAAANYRASLDVGRVPMMITKPVAPAPGYALTLSQTSALAAKLDVFWNGVEASALFHAARGAAD
jgi:hypothetical protein